MDAGAIAGIVIGVLIVITFGIFDGILYYKLRGQDARVTGLRSQSDARHNLYQTQAALITDRIGQIGVTLQQALANPEQAQQVARNHALAAQIQAGHEPEHRRASSRKRSQNRRSRKHRQRI